MKIQIREPAEQYIIDRLKREGRGGTVTKIEPGIYQYEIEVFDCNEMLPWLRTFTGRIVQLSCSRQSVVDTFFADLARMRELYGGGGGAV